MDNLINWIKEFLEILPIGSDGLKVIPKDVAEDLKKLIETHDKQKLKK